MRYSQRALVRGWLCFIRGSHCSLSNAQTGLLLPFIDPLILYVASAPWLQLQTHTFVSLCNYLTCNICRFAIFNVWAYCFGIAPHCIMDINSLLNEDSSGHHSRDAGQHLRDIAVLAGTIDEAQLPADVAQLLEQAVNRLKAHAPGPSLPAMPLPTTPRRARGTRGIGGRVIRHTDKGVDGFWIDQSQGGGMGTLSKGQAIINAQVRYRLSTYSCRCLSRGQPWPDL